MKHIWPELPLENWIETYDMLHLLSQIIGKIKLQFVPYKNHWWNIALYPTVTGLSTGIIPYKEKCFEIDFDFHSHKIIFRFNDDQSEFLELQDGSIKSYYSKIKEKLLNLDCMINIWPFPVEMEYHAPFYNDEKHRIYSRESVEKFHQIVLQVSKKMEVFRSEFTGKASPVHFFWGSFDLAVTLFSGRPAPLHAGAPNVAKEVMVKAYNAELVSFGFWPGKGLGEPAFYSYTYPEPQGYNSYKVEPDSASYNKEIGEYILPYQTIQKLNDPGKAILDFFKSSYSAAGKFGNWDRSLSNYLF
jgi:Family of unknown function (DUF5996)